MGQCADIYIIKKTRSKKLGLDFLDHFLPLRVESAEDYWFPHFHNPPQIIFTNAEDLMEMLEYHPYYRHSIYWRNLDDNNPNKHGMIFYTSDGYMIFGISRNHYRFKNTRNEAEGLTLLKDYFQTEDGYITVECPPEDNYAKFMDTVAAFNKQNPFLGFKK